MAAIALSLYVGRLRAGSIILSYNNVVMGERALIPNGQSYDDCPVAMMEAAGRAI
jgi:hypothetical protein